MVLFAVSQSVQNPEQKHKDNIHKRIIDRNDKNLPGVLQLGVVDVPGYVGARASRAYTYMVSFPYYRKGVLGGARTKGGRSANDNTLVLDLLGQVDLVTRGVFDEDVEVGEGVALLNEGRGGVVEEGALGERAREGGSETTSGEHGEY